MSAITMTNPLGPGTVNLSVNIPREERMILGRLAFERGESLGQFVRELLFTSLERLDHQKALAVAEARRQLKSAMLLATLIIGSLAAWLTGDDIEARRPKTVNAARIIRRAQEETI